MPRSPCPMCSTDLADLLTFNKMSDSSARGPADGFDLSDFDEYEIRQIEDELPYRK
jgi:hypothetical protein